MRMRIKEPGSSDGATPAEPVDEATGVDDLEGVAPSGATAISGTARVGKPDLIAEVAAQLRAGEITSEQAVNRLIDEAVRRQSATRHELEPKLRELLREYASSDPYLAAKIRRLNLGK